jgi:hypothetical protein
LTSKKIIYQLKASIDLEVRIFTSYGTSYRGYVNEVTDDDVELVQVKVCDNRIPVPGSYYYPRKAIILLDDIAVVEGGFFEGEDDSSWIESG